jgi:hypothetical protein
VPSRLAGRILYDVVAGGPGFIAVGGGSRGRNAARPEALIWVSDRGRRWQSVPLFGDAAEGTIRAITQTTDGYVAVGDGRAGAAVWRSTDGLGWQRVPHAEVFDGAVMFDVADGPAGLLAVGCQGGIDCATSRAWRSSDGVDWESLDSPPPGLPLAIAATDAGYLVSGRQPPGAQPMLVSSSDGQSWQPGTGLPAGPAGLAALGAFEGALAGGSSAESGASRALLLRSGGGTAWQSIGHQSFRGTDFADIAATTSGVLLLGSRTQRAEGEQRRRPVALWSEDLASFRPTPFPAASLRAGGEVNAAAFSANGSLIVAVGATNRPLPTIWFSRMATPRAASDQRADDGEASADQLVSPAPDSPAASGPASSEAPAG